MNIFYNTMLGLFFGTFGTTIGGLIGLKFNHTSNKVLSSILSFASGLMMSIVCFDLIPEALDISDFGVVIASISVGIGIMILCDIFVQNKINVKNNSLLKTGIACGIGLALHNFPEGLAIGSGFEASIKLGLSLAITIAIHDVPEGISMAVPMRSGGMGAFKVIVFVILSGVTTGIGAFFGSAAGSVSEEVIAVCLALSAGAMLYVSAGELIPEANNLYKGRLSALANILRIYFGDCCG